MADFLNYDGNRMEPEEICREGGRANIRSCMEILLFRFGCVSMGDMCVLLGCRANTARSAVRQLLEEGFIEQKPCQEDSFCSGVVYVLTRKGLSEMSRRYPDLTCYPARLYQVSQRNMGHARCLGLSLMSLWQSCQDRGLCFSFTTESSSGHFTRTDAVVNAGLTQIYLEQDMYTERKGSLIQKFYDYQDRGLSEVFSPSHADYYCMLFSFHKAAPCTHYPLILDIELMYYVARKKAESLSDGDIDGEDITPYITQDSRYSRHISQDYIDDLSWGILPKDLPFSCMVLGEKGIITKAQRKMKSLRRYLRDTLHQTLQMLGRFDGYGFAGGEALTFSELHDFLVFLSTQDAGYCERFFFLYEQMKRAGRRLRDFAETFLDILSSGCTDFLYPVFGGYSIYCCATWMLDAYVPLFLRDSSGFLGERFMENLFVRYKRLMYFAYGSSLTGKLSYSILSEGLSVCLLPGGGYNQNPYPIPINLRNCFSYEDEDGIPLICIEDISTDAGAYVRTYLMYRCYTGRDVVHLYLITHDVDDAIYLVEEILSSCGTIPGFERMPFELFYHERLGESDYFLEHNCILFLEKTNDTRYSYRSYMLSVHESDGFIWYETVEMGCF